jgi:hypothetical protein
VELEEKILNDNHLDIIEILNKKITDAKNL